jgi:NADH:ubiquinone oxidoreductase subunit 2 (subunit N)
LAALKYLIQMGISTNFLIAGLVAAYYIQDINDKIESTKTRISDYGKEVIKVTQDA